MSRMSGIGSAETVVLENQVKLDTGHAFDKRMTSL